MLATETVVTETLGRRHLFRRLLKPCPPRSKIVGAFGLLRKQTPQEEVTRGFFLLARDACLRDACLRCLPARCLLARVPLARLDLRLRLLLRMLVTLLLQGFQEPSSINLSRVGAKAKALQSGHSQLI